MSVRKHVLTAGVATVGCVPARCLGRKRLEPRSAAAAPGKLGKEDRALLAQARANGEATVTLLLAAKDGQNAAAVAALEAAGATVQYRNDDLSYLRVEIAVDSAEAVNSIDAVQSADVDQIVPLPSPEPGREPAGAAAGPAGTRDAEGQPVHADRRDGLRGVPRGAPDLGRPRDHDRHRRHGHRSAPSGARRRRARASGRSSTGSPARTPSPTTTRRGSRARPTSSSRTGSSRSARPRTPRRATAVTTSGASFNEGDSRFTGSEYGNDINRDGNPAGSSRLFGVLRDGDRVWVDTDQDLSFADEDGIRPYAKNYDVDTFGTDNPATAVTEIVPFVVQIAHGWSARRPSRRSTSTSASSPARTARTSRASRPVTGCSAAR